MQYKKITEHEPPIGEEVMTYNGETEFLNTWTGSGWKHHLRYPVTHWRHKVSPPPFEEVVAVREQLELVA